MGDPRHLSKKVTGPGHPWQLERIEAERGVVRDYGLKNKRELWKFQTMLKGFTAEAKRLIAATGSQAALEQKQLMSRLRRYGLVGADAKLDDVLGLQLTDLLNRRLQTQLVKRGMARSPRQARQFITHSHVTVGAKTVTSPSYLVALQEEPSISFRTTSTLNNTSHPERVPIQKKPRKPRPQTTDRRERRPRR